MSCPEFLLQKTVRAEREKVAAAFSRQRQFLEEQEKLLQAEMDELEKEIVGRRDEHQASLSAELSSLDNLQDFESILERCPVENPMAFPVALKCYQNRCLEDIMKKSQDSLINGLPLQKGTLWNWMENKNHKRGGGLVQRLDFALEP
ncbi:hypothetical protein lerEdw1_010487 [Lerista edwardsae]|nr:hypothetical protein lerEdw1_010487 [Lerista edwardsae]